MAAQSSSTTSSSDVVLALTLNNQILLALHDDDDDNDAVVTPTTKNNNKKVFGEWTSGMLLRKNQLKRKRVEIETITNNTSTTGSVEDKEDAEEQQQQVTLWQRKLEALQQDDSHEQFALQAKQKVQELRKVYLYGLSKVSALQDLRHAPDATLPGNQRTK